MRLLIINTFFLFIFCHVAFSQATDPINTDRPDQSDGTYTMSKNKYQLETGIIVGHNVDDYFVHDILLRYGITPSTEVRLIFDYGTNASTFGIFPPGISVKQHLINQKKWLPEITAVGYLRLPYLASEDFKTKSPAATVLLAFQNNISDQFSLGYNLGTTLDGDHSYKTWIVTASLSYTATKKLSFFAEYFSSFQKVIRPSDNVDIGALWLCNDHFQIDVAAGSTVFQEDKNKFLTTGISYRF